MARLSQSWILFLLPIILLVTTGCPPQFEDESCAADSDCFRGETCDVESGLCVLESVETVPTIDEFVATPNPAMPGDEVTLSWKSTDALSGRLVEDGDQLVALMRADATDGTYSFTADTSPRTFVLEVNNGTNKVTESVTVDISARPAQILTFEASPETIEPGQQSTLSWTTEDAVSARIVGGGTDFNVPIGSVESGMLPITLTQTTTFTIEARNVLDEITTQDVTVNVEGGGPQILSFSASRTAIVEGDSVTLSWSTTDADSISIETDTGTTIPVAGQPVSAGSVEVTPTETATYILRATNEFGTATVLAEVTVEAAISIDMFDASAGAITAGESVTLSWTTSGNPNLELGSGSGMIDISSQPVASGAVSVSPTSTTTYTLRATTSLQSEQVSVTVAVLPAPPEITLFEVSPAQVVTGGTITLDWQIDRATSISISGTSTGAISTAGKSPTGDSITLTANQSETFTLTASNVGGVDTATATVAVGNAVTITSFTSSPTAISPGQSATLSWTVANPTSIEIESNQGDTINVSSLSATSDSVSVSPTTTTTYTLLANGLNGPVTADVTVTVQPAVAISSFAATSDTIIEGDSTTLSWQTTDATAIEVSYVDGMGATQLVNTSGASVSSDSVSVSPTQTTTYTLTAQGFQGPVTSTETVTVTPAVRIDSFTSDRTAVAPSEPVTLSWQTANASSLSLTDSSGTAVDLTGKQLDADSVTVTPAGDETYELQANGPGGPIVQQITIEQVDPDGLTISEIHADPFGTNDGKQWVELTNTGTTILDLTKFSLGSGSAAYDEELVALSGTLAPGDCVVVGGPVSNADNGDPAFAQAVDFDPDLPSAGGVALFVGPVSEQSATRTPVASVVWGASNPNGLLDSDGSAKTELSPAFLEGLSLVRQSDSDALSLEPPTPGECFVPVALSPNAASAQATGTVQIDGFGLDASLDEFTLGGTTLTACSDTSTGVSCTLPTNTNSGLADLVVSRVNRYVSDGSGGLMSTPRTTAIDVTLTDAFTFETEIADPGATFYCGIEDPGVTFPVATGTSVTVSVLVYVAGETDVNGQLPAGWQVEAVGFEQSAYPYELFSPGWISGTFAGQVGNDVRYEAQFDSMTARTVEVAFRVSPDSGTSWYYCDSNASGGSDDGYQLGAGQTVSWQ